MAEVDWAAQREAIRQAVAKAAKLPDRATIGGKRIHKRVEWEGRDSAERWAEGGATCELRMGAIVPVGTLYSKKTYDAGSDKLLMSYGRHEHFTVTAFFEVDNQDPGFTASDTVAGRLRTRLQRPEILAILQTAGVAVRSFGQTINADYDDEDERRMSAAFVDLFLTHVAWDKDEPEDTDGYYFNHVIGHGTGDLATVDLDAGPPPDEG